jgi:ABC-2 type transport system ATP-binding protein
MADWHDLKCSRKAGMNAVEVVDLRKTYRARRRGRTAAPIEALCGASFAIAPGEVLGLLGPNGAGKSTTVRILATLSRPDAGQARVGSIDVVASPTEVRRQIGYVAQVSGVDTLATGRENLLLEGRLLHLDRRSVRSRCEELLRLMGLAQDADRLVSGYSGGMRRRLDIAMALMHRPRVLLLDKPTAGLDPEARSALWARSGDSVRAKAWPSC